MARPPLLRGRAGDTKFRKGKLLFRPSLRSPRRTRRTTLESSTGDRRCVATTHLGSEPTSTEPAQISVRIVRSIFSIEGASLQTGEEFLRRRPLLPPRCQTRGRVCARACARGVDRAAPIRSTSRRPHGRFIGAAYVPGDETPGGSTNGRYRRLPLLGRGGRARRRHRRQVRGPERGHLLRDPPAGGPSTRRVLPPERVSESRAGAGSLGARIRS
jgi:hypothetical protein